MLTPVWARAPLPAQSARTVLLAMGNDSSEKFERHSPQVIIPLEVFGWMASQLYNKGQGYSDAMSLKESSLFLPEVLASADLVQAPVLLFAVVESHL